MPDKKFPLEPMGAQVVLKQLDPEKVSKGGIIFPGQSQQPPNRARVMATGPGNLLVDGTYRPIPLNVGDVVWFSGFNRATEVVVDGEKYIILGESGVVAREVG